MANHELLVAALQEEEEEEEAEEEASENDGFVLDYEKEEEDFLE